MLGAIIGDIVGSRFEFNNTDKTDFKLFHKDCNFTDFTYDDLICAISIFAQDIKREQQLRQLRYGTK